MSIPRLAMLMCVRNEAELLAANLHYHHALGVERIYVFLDRCDDGSDRIAAAFPWVRAIAIDPDDSARFPDIPELHRVCMDRALRLAREEGFEWLMMSDADEFAFTDRDFFASPADEQILQAGNLPSLLSGVDADIDVVRLPTREVLTVALPDGSPFWQQHYFQDSLDRNQVTREVFDPIDNRSETWRGFLGHTQGKSIVRTAADAQAWGSHDWVRYESETKRVRPPRIPLKMTVTGILYHFQIINFRQWRDKYRKLAHEPDTWYFGDPIQFPKKCWKRVASTLEAAELEAYYNRWVAMPPDAARQLALKGAVVKDRTVESVLRKSGVLQGDEVLLPSSGVVGAVEQWSVPRDYWVS